MTDTRLTRQLSTSQEMEELSAFKTTELTLSYVASSSNSSKSSVSFLVKAIQISSICLSTVQTAFQKK